MPALRRPSLRAASLIAVALVVSSPAAADPAPCPGGEPPPCPSIVGVVEPRRPAEPVKPKPAPAPPDRELTAADVAGDPLPGDESGRIDRAGGDSTWRVIGRGVLYVPRLAIDLALAPFRAALWANERYQLAERYDRTFYNDAKTIGLYPTVSVDSALGITAGVGFVHRDLFGEHEGLTAQAAAGSRYRQIYSARLSSGDRIDRIKLGLDVGYERRPHDAFYGIGNGDRVTMTDAPIDPRVDAISIESHYRQYRSRVALTADLHAWRQLHVRAAGALSQVAFGAPDQGESIVRFYDPRGLIGWNGVRYGYGELELRWDDRRGVTVMEPLAVYSAGSLASVFGGRVVQVDAGRDFWRYGLDLQKFVRVADGPRVIAARFHGEAVTGSRDEVPFIELPALGGPLYLRGYALDQFRDRVAAFGSLAYQWDLSQWFSASVFADVGRVYPELGALSLSGLRMGYGVSLEAHRVESFALEGSIGSSIDGGLFVNLSFNPVYDLDERVRRR
jgi:hypothetical protein